MSTSSGNRTVAATRYVTPFREGGSVPGLMEADDDGMYVVKYHGAAQGPKALIAEFIGGEIGRALNVRRRLPDRILLAGRSDHSPRARFRARRCTET